MEEPAEQDDLDEDPEDGIEPFTWAELTSELFTSPKFLKWFGPRLDRFLEQRGANQTKQHSFARLHIVLAYLLAAVVFACLTWMTATKVLPPEATLPLFGTVVGAVFLGRRGGKS